jgi:hypothetical protein
MTAISQEDGRMNRKIVALMIALAFAMLAASLSYAQEKPPGVIVLKGAPSGGVKFDHATHGKLPNVKCTQCHHASKPEKAAKAEHENCTDCHQKVAAAPMKTKLQAAFHDPMAKSGTCINCHLEQNKAGKKAPTKCTECHKKENV